MGETSRSSHHLEEYEPEVELNLDEYEPYIGREQVDNIKRLAEPLVAKDGRVSTLLL